MAKAGGQQTVGKDSRRVAGGNGKLWIRQLAARRRQGAVTMKAIGNSNSGWHTVTVTANKDSRWQDGDSKWQGSNNKHEKASWGWQADRGGPTLSLLKVSQPLRHNWGGKQLKSQVCTNKTLTLLQDSPHYDTYVVGQKLCQHRPQTWDADLPQLSIVAEKFTATLGLNNPYGWRTASKK
jgi:hypothetical protein